MGQTAHQELTFWLIFFISLSLLWHIKPEQGLLPRTLNQQNFMSLPNKLNGLTCSVTTYMVHSSLPCWITHQELESQESAVSPVVRYTVLHLRWLHFRFGLLSSTWRHLEQFLWLMSFGTGQCCLALRLQQSSDFIPCQSWSLCFEPLGVQLYRMCPFNSNLEEGWMLVLEWKAVGSRQAHSSERNYKF